jgi:hypothetical protein
VKPGEHGKSKVIKGYADGGKVDKRSEALASVPRSSEEPDPVTGKTPSVTRAEKAGSVSGYRRGGRARRR